MDKQLKAAFRDEMSKARALYSRGDLSAAFAGFERAHILGQRYILTHTLTHWWMLKIGLRRRDGREVFGQVMRIIASLLFSRIWVPAGNTGGANVSPLKPMPIPADLQALLTRPRGGSTRKLPVLIFLPAGLAALVFAGALAHHNLEQADVDRQWKTLAAAKITKLGTVKNLAILPLVNWHARAHRAGLRTGAGVSYLIKADGRRILFDLGPDGGNESPLENNMRVLGIAPNSINAVFISHAHFDHMGGGPGRWARYFSPSARVFAPVPVEYGGSGLEITPRPVRLMPGLAGTGAIPRRLFMGHVEEQALVIHVQGKGLVLVVGCGHQTLGKLLERVERVFDEKIYGIVGDLHYPVPRGRIKILGLNAQRLLASGRGPLRALGMHDVEADILRLNRRRPGLVALGGHDTSDQVIHRFARVFGKAYKHVRVGEWITVQ